MSTRYVESSRLPTAWGEFDMHGFEDADTNKEHVVLTMGDVADSEPVLARVHSECLTGDALFSMRCDCGKQLQAALEAIAREGRGALFYLRQEGRGIGLLNKIKAYKLQDAGADTVEANEQLGFGADMRDYSILKPMFEHLHITAVRLMTNNPRKVAALEEQGVQVVERIALHTESNPHNEKYLSTKAGKLGHMFEGQG
ncbi:GTP cyclohydrolase II [Pseudohalioglobus sediminis]|uniref:GTP cyclohydrolase-2 n=1 Tax=Pseudohalioglobus sediminis TaxID=2606449 RepID=A0A5B0WPB2_9GAMM|nr:GTP cyclohydrolase II [Pseudohalioglobus sediminis]KAA1188842.1 GTP cyclohydrolase II [Pseudohalioglobus sediminis]